ncbi:MAG: cytochrome b [Nitratireductor sp.]
MSYKSTPTKFGKTAVLIHWGTAVLILSMFVLGALANNTIDPQMKAMLLRGHVVLGMITLLLTIYRIVWWTFFDKKPKDLETISNLQKKASHLVHFLLYACIIIMSVSGIGIIALSGAGDILFGNSTANLPDFHQYLPRAPHGIVSKVFAAILFLHIGAALHHHFILKDGLMKRMKLK